MEAVSDHARDQHPGPPLVITPPCGVSASAEKFHEQAVPVSARSPRPWVRWWWQRELLE